MLSTSDHHHAPAKRGRSPPATTHAEGASTGAPLAASPAAKKTKTDADIEPSANRDAYATWREPPRTPSRKKASTILSSKVACRDLIDDIGRAMHRETTINADPRNLDELEALGLAAHRLYHQIRAIMNIVPGYSRRHRVALPPSLETSQGTQTDYPSTTTTSDQAPAPVRPSVDAPDHGLPTPGRRKSTTAVLAAPETRGRVEPLRPARDTNRATHKPPVKGSPPRGAPPPRAPTQARSGPRSRPVARLIVRYGDAGTLRDRPRPHSSLLRNALNLALGGECIVGISYSRTGQLVLHPKAPFTAQQLALRGDVLRPVIRRAFGLVDDPRPVFETDAVWSKVVVHSVPLPPGDPTDQEDMDGKLQEFFSDLCSSNGFDSRLVRRMQPLCPKGKEEDHFRQSTLSSPHYLSVLLCIADTKLATRLLRDGAFWQGAHCRVSTYRPRNSG